MVKKIVRIILPVGILALGVFMTMTLMNKKKGPMMRPHATGKVTPLVKTIPAKEHNGIMPIQTYGTTTASASLSIASEASGRVIWMNKDMEEGKKITEGSQLFKIDPTEYELKAQQAKASLIEARYNLDLVKAQQTAAIKEYESFQKLANSGLTSSRQADKMSRLAKYEPQVESAYATLESAKAGLKIAELNLNRTITTAPMTGYFTAVSITNGQLITSNTTVATLTKSSPIVLKTPVNLSDLEWLSFEQHNTRRNQPSSKAIITKKIGATTHTWKGSLKRKLREISDSSRKAILIVEVANTMSDHELELPIGLYVDVILNGKSDRDLIEIPLDTVQQDSTVWVVNAANQLEIRKIRIDKQTNEYVYVSEGLTPNDRIITSSMTAPIPGMAVRVMGQVQQGLAKTGIRENNFQMSPKTSQSELKEEGTQPGQYRSRDMRPSHNASVIAGQSQNTPESELGEFVKPNNRVAQTSK